MPMITIHVWHLPNSGQIIGIGRVPPNSQRKVIPVPGQNQAVLESQIEEAAIATLHETHKVDLKSRTLVRAAKGR